MASTTCPATVANRPLEAFHLDGYYFNFGFNLSGYTGITAQPVYKMNDEQKKQLLLKLESMEREIQEIKVMFLLNGADEDADEEGIDATLTPEELLSTLFNLVQQEHDESSLPDALRRIVHSSIAEHSHALENFIRYSFKTFQGRWKDYLKDISNPNSFSVTRKNENNRGELSELRLYLHAPHRSPTPITLKQDPGADLAWRISSLSL